MISQSLYILYHHYYGPKKKNTFPLSILRTDLSIDIYFCKSMLLHTIGLTKAWLVPETIISPEKYHSPKKKIKDLYQFK